MGVMHAGENKRILVLGVGNILLRDEGVGVRVVHELMARYEFPQNVRVVDGGVLGLKLTGTLMEADEVVVVDAVRGGGEPGTIYRFEWKARPSHIHYKDSLHQIDLVEAMASLELIERCPKVVVLGVEYEDINTWEMGLSPKVEAAVERLVGLVIEELKGLGVEPEPKKEEGAADVSCSSGQGD